MNYLLALMTGLLLVVIYPGFNWHWLTPFAIAPLLYALGRERRAKHCFLLGYIAGWLHSLGVYYWFMPVLSVHGDMGEWGGLGTLLVYCFVWAFHFGLFSLIAASLIASRWAIVLIPALWVGMEWSQLPTTQFTWLLLGNAGADMGLPMRIAPWLGVYGLSFVFALTATAVALRRRSGLIAVGAIVVVELLLPALPAPSIPQESIVAIQPNIDPETVHWTWDSVQALERRMSMLSVESALAAGESKPAMVIWPELPAPIYYEEDVTVRDHLARAAIEGNAPIVMGTVVHDPKGSPLNSAVFINNTGKEVGRYDKMHLVPFGEYVPSVFWWVNKVSGETGTFSPGKEVTNFQVNGHRTGIFICYESALPGHVREFASLGAEVLAMLTNDGYFFQTAAREQHLLLARMRAAENNRWLLRVTNNGHTVSIDPAGRIVKRIPERVQSATRLPFSWIKETTFYTRNGDWFAWGCLLVSLLAAAIRAYQSFADKYV